MKPLFKLFSFLMTALVLGFSAPSMARDLGPVIPEPVKGEECVEDTQEMRVNHMKYLMTHRDDVMRRGIRTKQYHLSECLECHVPARDENQPMRADNTEHFCMSCHAFTGVKVDCFTCHATQPERNVMFHPIVTPGMKALKDVHQAPSSQLLQEIAARNQTGANHE